MIAMTTTVHIRALREQVCFMILNMLWFSFSSPTYCNVLHGRLLCMLRDFLVFSLEQVLRRINYKQTLVRSGYQI